jgi:hypothetical protein
MYSIPRTRKDTFTFTPTTEGVAGPIPTITQEQWEQMRRKRRRVRKDMEDRDKTVQGTAQT